MKHEETLGKMVRDLRNATGLSASISIDTWSFSHDDGTPIVNYDLYFTPGLDGTKCTLEVFKNWPALVARYRAIMEEHREVA